MQQMMQYRGRAMCASSSTQSSEPCCFAAARKSSRPISPWLLARPSAPSFDNMSIDEVEALLIRKVLRRCDGNISQAAEALGLSRAALYRRIEKYGL